MDLVTWLRAEWDRVLGFGLIALGAVVLVLGYLGVSNSPYVAEQLSYIVSGGLGGLFLLGAGATLLILADLHDEWRKLDRVEAMLAGEIPLPGRPQTNGAGPATAPVSGAPAPAAAQPALIAETRCAGDTAGPRPPATATAAAVVRRERFSLGIGLLLAVAVLFGSWATASGVDQPKPALTATAVAVFGLVFVALGAVGSTLTVKRHVQLRKARVFSPWLDAAVPGGRAAAPVAAGTLVTAPGLTRYHRAGCPSVVGLSVQPLTPRAVPDALAPCRLCDPDTPAS